MKLQHKGVVLLITFLSILLTSGMGLKTWAQTKTNEDLTDMMLDLVDEQASRLDIVEKKSQMDRINFTGDYRFQGHKIQTTVAPYYNGMMLQNGVVGAMFYNRPGGQAMPPSSWKAIQDEIMQNYAQYLYFVNNLTFAQLKSAMAQFPPSDQKALMGMLLPATLDNGGDFDNSLLYTNRLRFNFKSNITSKLRFRGRLSMYKTFGDSTGAQVFNGQTNSMNFDGTTATIPNSDILRVERAFFTWDIQESPMYISIGRRPATGGPPLHIRQGTAMGGTPMGSLVDYQFDGITLGFSLEEYLEPLRNLFGLLISRFAYASSSEPFLPGNTFRLCYGVGYESGFGNMPNNGLEDMTMFGFDWDIYHNEDMFIQLMYVQAKNVTDGFNGLVVLPINPVSGEADNSNHIMRYTASQNLGNLSLTGLVLTRHDSFIHYFLSWAQMESDPENVTTPFGGLFCDPFETPQSQTGNLLYMGARADLDYLNGMMVGLEYNKGSEYWFNFAHGADDILSPKLATRGSVIELYSIFTLNRWANLRLSWQKYDYEYSGSGWHMFTPKALDSTPILGFPGNDSATVISFSTNISF